jgi:hypothetical protein
MRVCKTYVHSYRTLLFHCENNSVLMEVGDRRRGLAEADPLEGQERLFCSDENKKPGADNPPRGWPLPAKPLRQEQPTATYLIGDHGPNFTQRGCFVLNVLLPAEKIVHLPGQLPSFECVSSPTSSTRPPGCFVPRHGCTAIASHRRRPRRREYRRDCP